MDIKVELDKNLSENEIIVKCREENKVVKNILEYAKNNLETIVVSTEEQMYKVSILDILYFDSVDNKTFVYLEDNVYTYELKLYEIEETLYKNEFIRISKSCILNLNALKSVKRMINGRLIATLKNGEDVVINRSYVKSFKERFGV